MDDERLMGAGLTAGIFVIMTMAIVLIWILERFGGPPGGRHP